MKKRHNVVQNLKQFCKMINDGQVVFDYPLQRDNNQWTHEQKSLLIHSIAVDYAVPAIYSVGHTRELENGFTQTIYSILDGKQRLNSINDYTKGLYPLHPNTPPVRVETEFYEIANLKFEELHQDIQDFILDYSLTMYHFINVTDDELSDMFYRLNNGTAMSQQQKVKSKMGVKAARTFNELKDHPFMTDCAVLSTQQKKRAGDEQVLMQAMILIDPEMTTANITPKMISEYAEIMKGGKKDVINRVEAIMDYLIEVDIDSRLLYNKKHIPFLFAVASKALDTMPPYLFNKWMDGFALFGCTAEGESYFDNAGTYTSIRKTTIALDAICEHFDIFMQRNKDLLNK